ncbi:MAG: type II secretion system protein [Chloroflexi bacterium]|nr:type II secretion system protein [Chloroflexota bacterium]
MKIYKLTKLSGIFARREQGTTLIETLIALAILGVVAAAFLSGLTTTAKGTIIADEQATAESLARSQMEWVKKATYVYGATEYSAASVPGGKDYVNYSATIDAEALNSPDNGIQRITVTINHLDKELVKLTGYKMDR